MLNAFKMFLQIPNFVGFPFFIPHENLCSRSYGKKSPSAAASINKRGLMLNLLTVKLIPWAQHFFVIFLPLWPRTWSINIQKCLKESGSTWDVDAKLPKFAENASHEFETIVSLMAKVFLFLILKLDILHNVEISHVCPFIVVKANFLFSNNRQILAILNICPSQHFIVNSKKLALNKIHKLFYYFLSLLSFRLQYLNNHW